MLLFSQRFFMVAYRIIEMKDHVRKFLGTTNGIHEVSGSIPLGSTDKISHLGTNPAILRSAEKRSRHVGGTLSSPAVVLCRHLRQVRGRCQAEYRFDRWLPKAFDLEDAFTGVRRAAHTVWRKFNFLGVQFRESKPTEKRHSDFGHRRHD